MAVETSEINTNSNNDNEDITDNKSKEKRDKIRTNSKVVIRRLPPSMTKEEFLEQVSPIPEHDYFYFCKPDPSLTPDLFSRAYINFVNTEDIYAFRDRFDDYIFLDAKGSEYPAVVEFAPFQRIPKRKKKKDPKSGSLETDPLYLEFLETLKEAESENREPKMEYSYQPAEEKKEVTSTPLLEYLANRKRDERRRREDRQKRKPRIRGSKEDNIPEEEEVKKIKPREMVKDKNSEDNTNEGSESKYERKKYEKKSDYDKKEFSGDKPNRKEKRERAKESAKEKFKEKKYESRKEKFKTAEKKQPSYKQMDENEIEGSAESLPSKVFVNKSLKNKSEDNDDADENVRKSKSDEPKVSEAKKKPKPIAKNDSTEDAEEEKQSRLQRNKSSEEKSQDEDEKSQKTDPRTERRIRNKDRPSIAIYQPGMGKFSKQRIGKDKDAGTYKSIDSNDSESSK